jgi:hypothetical protein
LLLRVRAHTRQLAGKEPKGLFQQLSSSKLKTLEAALDLNSILRGKKVRVVSGEDEVADCYALCVRVLQRSKVRG